MKSTKSKAERREHLRAFGFQFPGDLTLAQIQSEHETAQNALDRETLAKILPRLSYLFKQIQLRFPEVERAVYGMGGYNLKGRYLCQDGKETFWQDADMLCSYYKASGWHPKDCPALVEFNDLSEYLCDDLNMSTWVSEVTATGSKSNLGELKHEHN